MENCSSGLIRVAIQLFDIQLFCFPFGTLFHLKKEGPPLLTGESVGLEKRMGDRGTPTSNRREERAL